MPAALGGDGDKILRLERDHEALAIAEDGLNRARLTPLHHPSTQRGAITYWAT